MLNRGSIEAVERACFSTKFSRPLYDSYCFARIPETVEQLLLSSANRPLPVDVVGGSWDSYDLVVLFLIDGFGWEFFERYAASYPFLNRLLASKMTAQFPSTTAAHVTTIHTALEVGQTGIYEWFYYEPLIDRMIAPLLYSYAGDHVPGTLKTSGVPAERIYPNRTFYQRLQSQGVGSVIFQQEGIAHSPYSKVLSQGASVIPFHFFKDGLESLVSLSLSKNSKTRYLYCYFGDIDAMGHRHGIDSQQFHDAVDYCFKMLEQEFWQKLSGCGKRIGIMVTADHGMVAVDPKTTIYLNLLMPEIVCDFKTNQQGMPLVPAGSCRDFFLHIKESRVRAVIELLRQRLDGIAEVYLTEELIQAGFFGLSPVSDLFRERVGNVVILPYAGQGIYWYEKHRFEQHFYASHGGLTPQEMHSIFLFGAIE